MKRILCFAILVGLVLLAGCNPQTAQPQAVSLTPQAFLPVVGTGQESTTPQAFMPLVSQGNGECKTHTAGLTLSASAATLKVGDVVTVTATLANQGCVALGLPQYRLTIQADRTQPIFEPANPEPVVHSLAVGTGQSDTAQFALRAVGAGQATLNGTASFEVHLGYPGPAYWGGAGAAPLVITVTP
jgi:hypothetical protein